jgi:hypothetical protein
VVAWSLLATATAAAQTLLCDIRAAIVFVPTIVLVVVVARRIIMVVVTPHNSMIVIARSCLAPLWSMMAIELRVQLAGASVTQSAPEYRVQQNRCDSEESARGVHAIWSIF